MRFRHFLPLALLFFAVGCKPSVDEGIELPTSPTASFDWEYLYVDTAATPYTDSNRVVFTSQAEEGFLHFWDFDNGLTSNEVTDTRSTLKQATTRCPTLFTALEVLVWPQR